MEGKEVVWNPDSPWPESDIKQEVKRLCWEQVLLEVRSGNWAGALQVEKVLQGLSG